MRYYHGTSYPFARRICSSRNEGFSSPNKKTIYTDSDPNVTYFISEQYDLDDKSELTTISLAVKYGQIAAALYGNINDKIVIFELTIDDTYMTPDMTCKESHMYQIDSQLLNHLLQTGKATIKAYACKNAFTPKLCYFYLAQSNAKNYANLDEFSEKIVKILHENNQNCDFIKDKIGTYTEIKDFIYPIYISKNTN